MAGTLEVSDELCWMPAGWVYDGILERIASAIKADRPSIADTLLRARTGENGGYLDLRPLRARDLCEIEHAADAAYTLAEGEGPSSFRMPGHYDGFMQQFRALREMLRLRSAQQISSDPRATTSSPTIR